MADNRKIIHVDMDAFYASVEQRDNPKLKGLPVIVGGQPDSRGVVAACSYEARRFGIHSAMPSSRAYRLCPEAVFIRPRFDAYRETSAQLRSIFEKFTDLIEPLSLDEAYLDVTACPQHQGSATLIAKEIKRQVKQELKLTASAGVSYNKFLAKVASDMDKPDGLYIIRPEQAQGFIDQLPIGKFFGVGKVTEQKMHQLGISNGADLYHWSEIDLCEQFGKSGHYYYRIARGIDHRPVNPNRIRKSIGKETTFGQDLTDLDTIKNQLKQLIENVSAIMQKRDLTARTMTIKVKYNDFTQITRSISLKNHLCSNGDMNAQLDGLIQKTELGARPCRLLGVSVSNFVGQEEKETTQPELFG